MRRSPARRWAEAAASVEIARGTGGADAALADTALPGAALPDAALADAAQADACAAQVAIGQGTPGCGGSAGPCRAASG